MIGPSGDRKPSSASFGDFLVFAVPYYTIKGAENNFGAYATAAELKTTVIQLEIVEANLLRQSTTPMSRGFRNSVPAGLARQACHL
jgi:hypothetical protein